MKKNITYLFILVSVLLFGCTQNNLDGEIENEKIDTVMSLDGEIVERSEKISDLVVELYGVDDATTIILEDAAIIGVKIAYEEKLTEKLNSTIEKTVLDEAPGINDVLITDKSNIFSEINNLVAELLQGESYDSLVNEIAKIKNKIY